MPERIVVLSNGTGCGAKCLSRTCPRIVRYARKIGVRALAIQGMGRRELLEMELALKADCGLVAPSWRVMSRHGERQSGKIPPQHLT